ncbi:MAG: rod shape-determining protein [Methanolobus sp.]
MGLKNSSDYMDDFTGNNNFLYLGIDAGMFKTSICTSDGDKFSERTVVAFTSNDGEGSDEKILSGKEALEFPDEEISKPLNAGLKNESDIMACRKFLQHILEKHNVDMDRAKTYAILGVPTNVEKAYKKKLLELSREIFSGAMIVDEIFCIAYRNGILEKSLIVDIGFSNTDICIINGDAPKDSDQLSLPCAGKDIDREIVKLLHERWPDSKVTEDLARQWKEDCGHLIHGSKKCVVDLPLENGQSQESIEEEIQIACEFVVTDIVSGITRVLSDAEPVMRESLRNNIHIFGGTSKLDGIGTFIENELKELGGGKVFLDLDSVYGISEGALELAKNMPNEFWKQLNSGKENKEL